jgi:hypothetical protein
MIMVSISRHQTSALVSFLFIYSVLQAYIQSRGRARMRNSELVMMVQEGAAEERRVSWRSKHVNKCGLLCLA